MRTREEIEIIEAKANILAEIVNTRNKLGYTQTDIAEKTGVRAEQISRLENDKTNPTLDSLLKTLSVLGKTIKIVDK